ncbi:MAG: asparagine synthase (glutamine-hydrolyzing) [Bacteroidetes bacterium]|nr:asparagine synthase (glutamine-hydrolyzing) [Bacteroidota bacterium]
MCGITGIIGQHINNPSSHSAIKKMNDAIAHRGPNSEGVWNDEHCFLAHRRLSIIDLSEAGNQPFLSQDGRYVMVYNGELYNYRDIKLELQRAEHGSKQLPYIFKTNTDTEVILAAYLRWGVDCVKRFNGMFAFAIWDTVEQKLVIVRDRLGVKPLYYHYKNGLLCFASEIRALIHSGLIDKKISLKSVAEYVQYATVHAPNTILQDIYMLMPGHILECRISNSELQIQQYWNINDFANPKTNKYEDGLTYKETCTKVNELLTASVERRLVADVPFGAFLSGGIDSSAIVGLMSKVSSEKVQTFNVSFDEGEFSEALYAKQISEKFNTEHHEIKLTPNDFLKQLPEALAAIDHPSGDGPNSYIVSKATKHAGITMALSGLGGDELFAGYDIFKRYYELEKKGWLNLIPAKGLAGKVLAAKKKSVQGDKTAEILNLDTINGFNAYPVNRKLFNQTDYNSLIKENYNADNFIKNIIKKSETDKKHILSRVSLFEIQTYMQNVLLRDADQMSMAVALEVRVPFLDYQLVEFALSINDEYKYPHTPKKLLTDALGDLLPDSIVNRPKMGFTLPWKEWLKEDLKDFCEDNIVQLSKRSFINREALLLIWNRFLSNDPKVTWSRVWHLIILNHWINTHQIDC